MKRRLHKSEITTLRRAAEELHETDRDYRRAANYDFIIYLLMIFLVAFSVRTFVGEPIRVDGKSMYPSLEHNERMIVEKMSYYVSEPQRGDIIVCYYPNYKVSCVKRVIGLPGDTVSVLDGAVYINSHKLDESAYWNDEIWSSTEPIVVPEDHVFVMGDNRNHSQDSRNEDVGPIPYNKIVGRAVYIMWPFDTMRSIPHELYA